MPTEFTDSRAQELEARLSEADIINHQLQMTLSETQLQQVELRKQLDNRNSELRKSEEQYRLLRIEFDQLSDEMQVMLEGEYGGGVGRSKMNLRGSVSIAAGYVETNDRWVQTSNDLMVVPEHIQNELDNLHAEVASLQRALDRAARDAERSAQHSRSGSYMTSDSGDLRSNDEDEPTNMNFVPPPPLNLARQLVMPPAIQSSIMLHEEPSMYPDDTPRFASLTGRLRADQPLNLTQALAMQSQRQLTSRKYLATPRGGCDSSRAFGATPRVPPLRVGGDAPQHLGAPASSVNPIMSPRLTHLANKFASATPRLSSSAARASLPANRPHRGISLNDDEDSDAHAVAANESLEEHTTSVMKHVDPASPQPASLSPPVEPRRVVEGDAPSPIAAASPSPSAAASPDSSASPKKAHVEQRPATAAQQKASNLSITSGHEDDYGPHDGRTTRRFRAEMFNDHDSPKRRSDADALFSLSVEDPLGGASCSICDLMTYLKEHFTRMACRQSYFAAGFIPEMCERWQLEHDIVWTIEERAAIATALHAKPQLASFSTWHLASEGKYWRHKENRFWKSNWKDCFFLLQGVFLYIFPSGRSTDRLLSVSLIRSANITVQRSAQDKLFVIRLECLGCGSCVGAHEDEHVQEVLIGFKHEDTMLEWKETIHQLSMTCPHMCSSKFANSVSTLREMCEDLLLMSYREEKRAARKQMHQNHQNSCPLTATEEAAGGVKEE